MIWVCRETQRASLWSCLTCIAESTSAGSSEMIHTCAIIFAYLQSSFFWLYYTVKYTEMLSVLIILIIASILCKTSDAKKKSSISAYHPSFDLYFCSLLLEWSCFMYVYVYQCIFLSFLVCFGSLKIIKMSRFRKLFEYGEHPEFRI